MTSKILAYCKCSAAEAAEMIKLYEAKYNCKYNWNESYQNIPDAEVVAIKEVNGHRYVITHSNFELFVEHYDLKTTKVLGEL